MHIEPTQIASAKKLNVDAVVGGENVFASNSKQSLINDIDTPQLGEGKTAGQPSSQLQANDKQKLEVGGVANLAGERLESNGKNIEEEDAGPSSHGREIYEQSIVEELAGEDGGSPNLTSPDPLNNLTEK